MSSKFLTACSLLPVIALRFVCAGTLYVSLSGDDKNNGATPETAWRTIAAAMERARGGDTVFIKAGNYGKETVEIRGSGTPDNPISFEGYREKPGDRPFPAYKPGDDLDPALMPVLDGGGVTERGVYLRGRKHIRLRNIGIKRYRELGIFSLDSSHVGLESVVVTDIYKTEGHTYAVGIYFIGGEHNSARNCILTNASGDNIAGMHSDHLLIENCKTYGTLEDGLLRPDYYIVIGDSHDCTIRDCLAHNLHPNNGCGHGIGIKDQAARGDGYPRPHSRNNLVVNCTVYNSGEHLWVAHEAHHNEFVNCTAISDWRTVQQRWSQGINVRDGAHHNTFRNCRVVGARFGSAFGDSVEGPTGPDGSPVPQTTHSNSFLNCVFADTEVGVEMWATRHNLFRNCVVDATDTTLFEFWEDTTGYSLFSNTVLTGVRGAYANSHSGKVPGIGFTFCDFWKNQFPMPAGHGNFEQDPLFADPAARDFHLKSEHGRWVPGKSEWVKDALTSPCIDAGSPADTYEAEPKPNGGRVNVGAYGNTAEASKSKPEATPGELAAGKPADPMLRVHRALCGTAPEGDALEGKGVLRAAGFLWLPDSPECPPVNAALKRAEELCELVLRTQVDGGVKGWVAVEVPDLCRPCTVVSPDGETQEAQSQDSLLLFRIEKPGTWRIAGLPSEGTLSFKGAFACKRFSVKFAKDVDTKLIYRVPPGPKTFRFERKAGDAGDEGELAVNVEQTGEALVVREDGQLIDRVERKGQQLRIRAIRPNVTYEIRKQEAKDLPKPE
jgi:hypothetical protein